MKLPNEIKEICDAFLRGLQNNLGNKLHGVYLYGAIAFPEKIPVRDIDFHVILRQPLNDQEKTQILELHKNLSQDFPFDDVFDGYYILLDDAFGTSPPKHQIIADCRDESWALHCEHIRAGRCIVLYGPDPKQIYPPASWEEIEIALKGEWDYVANHLSEYPDYCVLNLCRLMYSYSTRDVVVSKRESGRWASEKFPEWRNLIDAAIKSYDNLVTVEETQLLKSQVKDFFNFAHEYILRSK